MQTNVFGLILVAVILALAEASFSQTIIVDDDFEAYQTDTELLEAWTPWNPVQGFHSNNGTALTIDPDNSYGGMIDGQAAEFCGQSAESGVCGEFGGGSENYPTEPGTVNRWSTPFNISPSSTHNIVLSADVGDDALSPNVRLTIGLRNSAIPANLIELGMYNSPIPGFHYRAILFPEEPEGTVGWVNYGDESIMDIPLPDGLDTQDAVGPGFHTFKAVISLDTVIFTLVTQVSML